MGVEIQQDEVLENCFIITLYSGWDWDDIAEMNATVNAARQQAGDTPIHVFTRIEGPITMPLNIENQAKNWLNTHVQQNGGLLVFITEWDMVRSLIKLMSLGEGNPFSYIHFANSIEEARAVVQHGAASKRA